MILSVAVISASFPLAFQEPQPSEAAAAQGPIEVTGPSDGELFPWEDPSSNWAPLEIRATIRSRGERTEDRPLGAETGSRVGLDDARLSFQGALEDAFAFVFTFSAGDEGDRPAGEVELLEGYADFELDERHGIRFGKFKRPLLRSALTEIEDLTFFDRTQVALGANQFDVGVRADGRYELLDLTFALQNGDDGSSDGTVAVARAELHPLGGGTPLNESLFRSDPETHLSVGIGYADDSSLDQGGSWAFDAAWRRQRWQVLGEFVDNEPDTGDNNPYSLSVMHMPFPDEWTAGLRYQEVDDASDTEVYSAVVKRYFLRGRVVAHLQGDLADSKDPERDGWRAMLGLSLSF